MIARPARVLAVAGGELRQRAREPVTIVLAISAMLAAAMLIPGAHAGYVTVTVAGARPLITTGSAASMCGVLFALFFALPTYFVAGGSFARDTRSGLDQLLAASPLRDIELVAGRALAYVALFWCIVAAAGLVLGPTFALRAERPFDVPLFYLLFAAFALPGITFFAVLGVAVDAVVRGSTGVKAGLGIVAWLGLAGLVLAPGIGAFDVFGFGYVRDSLAHALAGGGAFSMGIVPSPAAAPTFAWDGVTPSASWVIQRLGIALLPLVLVVAGALGYRRMREAAVRRSETAKAERSRLPAAIPLDVAAPRAVRWFLADVWLRVCGAPRTAIVLALTALLLAALDPHAAKLVVLLFPFAFMRSPDLRPDEGAEELFFAMPGVRARYAAWKTLDVFALSLLAAAPVLVHVLIAQGPSAAVLLACGIALECAWLVGALLVTRGPMFGLATALLGWYSLAASTPPPFDYVGMASYDAGTIARCASACAIVVVCTAILRRVKNPS